MIVGRLLCRKVLSVDACGFQKRSLCISQAVPNSKAR